MAINTLVKIMIIDHDPKSRNILSQALSGINHVKVISKVPTFKLALDYITRLSPDLIMLEYEMPGIKIEKAISEIKRTISDIEVILISETRRTTSESSQMALKLGALYFIRKPKEGTSKETVQYYGKYLKPIIDLYRVNQTSRATKKKVHKRISPRRPVKITAKSPTPDFTNYNIVAIGCSLGGPQALKRLIPILPDDFPLPIVVVQHMPKNFTASFSASLDARSKLIVIEAQGGELVRPGYVYIARGGEHMVVIKNPVGFGYPYTIGLQDSPPVNGCKPAVDVLFKSLATSINGNVMALVLTGMGQDGLDGIKALKEKRKCFCITQDDESSVVYGMPGEIAYAGLSDLSLPIDSIAKRLISIICRNKSINCTR